MIGESFLKLLPFGKKEQPISNTDGGISAEVDYIVADFNAALDFESENLERSSENWNLYKGYGGSSYPEKVRNDIIKAGRNPFEGNIIRQKVDGLAGSIIKNFFDISFEPVNGEHSDLTRQFKELMLTDKELLDWNTSYRRLVIDGLIHNGIEEIYIDTRYSPYGNIGFRPIAPNHIILDPYWVDDNAWNLKKAYKVAYLTPQEIKDTYNTKSEEIDFYLKLRKQQATNYDNGDENEGVNHYEHNETYGDKFRVIEKHCVKKEKKIIEIIASTGQVMPEGSKEYKQEWAKVNNVDMSMGTIKRTHEIDLYYVTTICPGISRNMTLVNGHGLIQIGRLPFFPWSACRINGKNSGIPDLLKSIQRTYNYRESMLDYSIATSANGGKFVDPDIVGSDESKMRDIESKWNKPSFTMWTEPGALASGRKYIEPMPATPMDYGIVNEINRMIDMADMVSKQPSAMDARSEGSEESGILYARKQLQAEVTQTVLVKALEQHWNDKGEAYFLLAKQLYSGVYRTLYAFGSNRKIEINAPKITPSGEVVENDISMLPRLKVVISQSPDGVTSRTVDRSINTELLRVVGPENPLSRAQMVKNVMRTLDTSKTDKAKFEESTELEYQFAKENLITQILGLKSQQMQIQMQLQQSMQPPMPSPEEEEGMEQPKAAEGAMGQAGGQPGGGEATTEQQQAPGNPQAEMQGSNVAAAQMA